MADGVGTAARLIQPLARFLHLPHLQDHADTFFASLVFFTFVHLVLVPVLSQRLFPNVYGPMDRRGKNNWSIHFVSLLHAVMIVPLAARAFNVPALNMDRAFGWDDKHGTLAAIACGYFLWDSLESIIFFKEIGFIIHGLACLFIYGLSFKPFLAYYGARFLIWELSTPFLNINWFLDKTGQTGTRLQLFNGLCLLSTFAGARLIYGGIMSYDFFQTLYSVRDELPTIYLVVYGLGNIALQSLNWFWFTKMIAALRKRMKPAAKGPVTKPTTNGMTSAHSVNGRSTLSKRK